MADDKRGSKVAEKGPSDSSPATGESSNVAPFAATGRGKPCPICGRPSTVEMRPFCSKRCADIDLGRWLGEIYRVPSADSPSSDEPSREESPPSNPSPKDGSRTG